MTRKVSPATAALVEELAAVTLRAQELRQKLQPNVKRYGTITHAGVRISYVKGGVSRRTDTKAVEEFFASHGAAVPKREVPTRESVRVTIT